ncbi:hypothetical protein PG990_009872 [Apiospora arundinis]
MLAAALGVTTAAFHSVVRSLRLIVSQFTSIDVKVLRAAAATIMCLTKTLKGDGAAVRKRARPTAGPSSGLRNVLALHLKGDTLGAGKGLTDCNDNVVGKLLSPNPGNRPPTSFPRFREMPAELRMAVWDMAAEFGCDIKVQQACQCSHTPKELFFKTDNQDKVTDGSDEEGKGKGKEKETERDTTDIMCVTRQRLALLHVCHESRTYLGPRYDAFAFRRDPRPEGRGGIVEAPGDLILRSSSLISTTNSSNSSRGGHRDCGVVIDYKAISRDATGRYQGGAAVPPPVLTWKVDHCYPKVHAHCCFGTNTLPHVLLDVRQDTFSGRVNWTGNPWCYAKFSVQHCTIRRPESPFPGLDPGRALGAPSGVERGRDTSGMNNLLSLLSPQS